MKKNKNQNEEPQVNNASADSESFSLNDDRRVKVLSPSMLVFKRFIRNSLAVTGLSFLLLMFLFSFVGGLISPYSEDQQFYHTVGQVKDVAGIAENNDYTYAANGDEFAGAVQSYARLAISEGRDTFQYRDTTYTLTKEGKDFYSISLNGKNIGIAYIDLVNPVDEGQTFSYDFIYNALKVYAAETEVAEGEEPAAEETAAPAPMNFTADGAEYTVDADGYVYSGEEMVAYIDRYVTQSILPDFVITKDFREALIAAIDGKVGSDDFGGTVTLNYTDENGKEFKYELEYDALHEKWDVQQDTKTTKYYRYGEPDSEHWLGTDRNGMDMLTRLMYGGRVSLVIGFVVMIISTLIGVILGGISGYFGGWIDNVIMRLVDVFYCIPTMPIIIILGAMMDEMRVDPDIRMLYLMLLLGVLGWAGIARLVRGQILSLREQEFMTATEACGVRVSRRIFKHLIPNVIPQLIVTCTMGLGSTIITEATLSFLGLGVKYPYASWGNIINDVNDTYVLTTYWFIWIPAGICLLLTVLAFNLVGDGLRDCFDPKMKR